MLRGTPPTGLVEPTHLVELRLGKVGVRDEFQVEYDKTRVYGAGMLSNDVREIALHGEEIAVVDNESCNVVVFNLETGAWIRTVGGSEGEGEGEADNSIFRSPSGLAYDLHGNMYVSDWINRVVQIFNDVGLHVRDVKWEFNKPYGLAFTPSGDLVVVDGDQVLVLQGSDTEDISLVHCFGGKGSGAGKFRTPRGVCVAADGTILVADYGNCRIQLFSAQGVFLHSFIETYGVGELLRPFGVAVGVGGHIVVSDYRAGEISVFTPWGRDLIQRISKRGDSKQSLSFPWGVAVDSKGNVFVADTFSGVEDEMGRVTMLSSTV
jgi:DNA-binding beta-propeller fold protein YncE